MNDRKSSKYNMYLSTIRFCRSSQEVWKDIPAYEKALGRLDQIVAELDKNNFKLSASNSDFDTKSSKRKDMEFYADLVGGSVRAFASATGNEALKADASVSLRQIALAKESDADDIALYLHGLGIKYIAEAADFGLQQSDLDSLAKSIEHFNELIGKPKLSIAESKATREQMELLFKEADKILNDQLDNMSLRFAKTNPEYYSRYQSARNVMFRSPAATKAAVTA